MSEETPEQTEGHPARLRDRRSRRPRPCPSRQPTAPTTGRRRGEDARSLTDLVEQPAKVMRIGSMIRQLLEEVKSAPLDEASRTRLRRRSSRPRSRSSRTASRPSWSTSWSGWSLPFDSGTPTRVRAADRPGPAGRLARGPVPRHPDRDLRPADGRPRPARADAPRAARGRAPSDAGDGPGCPARPGGRRAHRAERDVPVGRPTGRPRSDAPGSCRAPPRGQRGRTGSGSRRRGRARGRRLPGASTCGSALAMLITPRSFARSASVGSTWVISAKSTAV